MVSQKEQSTAIVPETSPVTPVGAQPPAKPGHKEVSNPWLNKRPWQILGIVLAVVAGFLSGYFWGWEIFLPKNVDLSMLLGIGIFVLVGVGAFLFRSWWAFLFVPLAWLAGEILGVTMIPFIKSSWASFQVAYNTWHSQLSLSFWILVGALVIGTVIGGILERRFWKQQS